MAHARQNLEQRIGQGPFQRLGIEGNRRYPIFGTGHDQYWHGGLGGYFLGGVVFREQKIDPAHEHPGAGAAHPLPGQLDKLGRGPRCQQGLHPFIGKSVRAVLDLVVPELERALPLRVPKVFFASRRPHKGHLDHPPGVVVSKALGHPATKRIAQ